MQQTIRLAGIEPNSLVNGQGLRMVLFAQGCKHNCDGCFNTHTHSFNGGRLMDMNKIIKDIINNPLLDGVTFSGGDPFEQADKFVYIAQEVKKHYKNVWCYTGYTFEELLMNAHNNIGWTNLLQNIDILVDGKFVKELTDENLKFKGSSNQRIIDVQRSLKEHNVILWKE